MGLFSKKSGKDDVTPPAPTQRAAAPVAAPSPPTPSPQPRPQAASASAAPAQQSGGEGAQLALLALGEVISVLMRSEGFQAMPLGSIANMVGPALSNRQFMVARASEGGRPVGACLWASVSPAVDGRLSRDLDKPITLTPEEWKSGDIVWVIAVTGERGAVTSMLNRLRASNASVKMRARDKDGAPTLHDLNRDAGPNEIRAN